MGDNDNKVERSGGRKREDKLPVATSSASSSTLVKVPKKKGRRPKAKGFPKRPLSAYNWFFKEERQKVLNLDFQSMGKEISTRWKATTKEQRKRFEELAAEDAIRYKKEVQIYEEEQILKARRMRELSKQQSAEQKESDAMSHMSMPSGIAALDTRANALLNAAAVRAMEEKNHPDAPQRLSPRLDPLTAGSMGVSALEMARHQQQQQQQQQLNQMLLANEMQNMQQQALQRQLALGALPQLPTSNALLLEQLRRQEELTLLSNAQQRSSAFLPQDALLNDYIRLQQQQQLQEQNSLNALRQGSMGLSFPGGLNRFSQGVPSSGSSQFSSLMNARETSMQNPYMSSQSMGSPSLQQASAAASMSLQNANLPVYSGSEADREALLRSLAQPKPEG